MKERMLLMTAGEVLKLKRELVQGRESKN